MDPAAYYDHHATVTLQRPLVVSGMVPAEARQLAHRVACLHGLRYTDFRAALEHRAGMSRAELEEERTPSDVRRLEVALLNDLMRDRPFGIIALPDHALSMRASKKRVERESFFVVLDYTVHDCYRRSRTAYEAEAPQWILEAPSAERLRALYRQWVRRFRRAHVRLPMEDTTWANASRSLIAQLEACDWQPA